MTVRSRRFFEPLRIPVANTFVTLWTVPIDRTARASLFTVSNLDSTTRLVVIALVIPGGLRALFEKNQPPQSTDEVMRGWVGAPGDELQVLVSGANTCDVAGFGSLLVP